MTIARRIAFAVAALAVPAFSLGAAPSGSTLKAKMTKAYAAVSSYKLTVLGSVRSVGVWNAPDRYQMTTTFQGKPIKTILIGNVYWIENGGKWQKSGNASNSLQVDITGLLRSAKANPSSAFSVMPDQTEDGKSVGTFGYTFKNGTSEVCNYDKTTFRATRCKSNQITILYSGYNDPSNKVANPT